MESDPCPPVSRYPLGRSLLAADRLAESAEQVNDPALRRVLLQSACRLLDRSLTAGMDPGWRPASR